MINLNYDTKNDILYLAFADKSYSYGDEIIDGYVVMKDLFSEEVTGVTIFDFLIKYKNNQIPSFKLPINIDFKNDVIPLL